MANFKAEIENVLKGCEDIVKILNYLYKNYEVCNEHQEMRSCFELTSYFFSYKRYVRNFLNFRINFEEKYAKHYTKACEFIITDDSKRTIQEIILTTETIQKCIATVQENIITTDDVYLKLLSSKLLYMQGSIEIVNLQVNDAKILCDKLYMSLLFIRESEKTDRDIHAQQKYNQELLEKFSTDISDEDPRPFTDMFAEVNPPILVTTPVRAPICFAQDYEDDIIVCNDDIEVEYEQW